MGCFYVKLVTPFVKTTFSFQPHTVEILTSLQTSNKYSHKYIIVRMFTSQDKFSHNYNTNAWSFQKIQLPTPCRRELKKNTDTLWRHIKFCVFTLVNGQFNSSTLYFTGCLDVNETVQIVIIIPYYLRSCKFWDDSTTMFNNTQLVTGLLLAILVRPISLDYVKLKGYENGQCATCSI